MKKRNLPEMIITKFGDITFPDIAVSLSPKGLTPEALSQVLGKYKNPNQEEWVVGTGYTWQYYIVLFDGEIAYLGFCFHGDQLFMLSINVELPDQELFEDWPTKKSSQREIKFIQQAFQKQFNGRLKYGKAYHVFDEKSYCAQCGISYART